MKSFHIITFGCQMNEHDSERMAGILEAQGWLCSPDVASAEAVIFNTCSIREKAEQKFYSELGRLRELKKERPAMKIVVAGCIAQQEGKTLLSRANYIDMVIGTSDLEKLPMFFENDSSAALIETAGDPEYHLKSVPASRNDTIKAWVSIMYGCDNFCSYCVVPYLRGRERSRPPKDIIEEIDTLARKGFREVTLLGQNVNSYGKGFEDPIDFPALLKLVNDQTGIERVRFVTSHPRDLSQCLIEVMRELPKVCESLHLPVQSGANNVLKAMNRGYTREHYLNKVSRLKESVPDIVLTTDIIVGFPGETNNDFKMTMKLLEEVKFDSIFAFKYSKRPGTAALKLSDHVEEEVKEKRLSEVLALQKQITLQKNHAYVGTIKEILVDGHSKRGGKMTGRTRGNKIVNFDGSPDLMGSFVNVRITAAGANSLTGKVCA